MTRVSELGKTRNFDHGKYRSLILIGEDIGEVRSATLIALRDMARDYRARWSHDLKDARAGRGDFVDWGVVQVILCEGPEIYSSSEAQTLEVRELLYKLGSTFSTYVVCISLCVV